ADSVPLVVLPAGYPRSLLTVPPHFNAYLNFQQVTKAAEQVTLAAAVPAALRRAFSQVRNGRPRPVLVEIPTDVLREEIAAPLTSSLASAAASRPPPTGWRCRPAK